MPAARRRAGGASRQKCFATTTPPRARRGAPSASSTADERVDVGVRRVDEDDVRTACGGGGGGPPQRGRVAPATRPSAVQLRPARFSAIARHAPPSFSTSTARRGAPRDSASIARAPLPANRSSTAAPRARGSRIPNSVCFTRSAEGSGARGRAPPSRTPRADPAITRPASAIAGGARGSPADASQPALASSRPSAGRRRSLAVLVEQPLARAHGRAGRELAVLGASEVATRSRGRPLWARPRTSPSRRSSKSLLRELEAVGGGGNGLEPLVLGRALRGLGDEDAERRVGAAPDAAAELVELGEPEPLRALDDHHRRRRHVDADLDHGRADEHVQVAVAEAGHLGVAVGRLHPAVDEAHPERREQLARAGPRSASAAAAQPVSTSSSAARRRRSSRRRRRRCLPPRPGRGRPDPGHDDERAPARCASSRTLSHVPSRSSGRRIPVRIGTRPAGARPQRRDVEVRVEDLAQRPRDRRRGHQQDVGHAAGRLRLERAALLHAEPVLLVDDGEREVREAHGLLEQRVRPHDDPRLAGRDRLERVLRRDARRATRSAGSPGPRGPRRSRRPFGRAGGRGGRSGRAARPACRASSAPPRAPTPRRRSCPSRRRPGRAGASARAARGRRGSRRSCATGPA